MNRCWVVGVDLIFHAAPKEAVARSLITRFRWPIVITSFGRKNINNFLVCMSRSAVLLKVQFKTNKFRCNDDCGMLNSKNCREMEKISVTVAIFVPILDRCPEVLFFTSLTYCFVSNFFTKFCISVRPDASRSRLSSCFFQIFTGFMVNFKNLNTVLKRVTFHFYQWEAFTCLISKNDSFERYLPNERAFQNNSYRKILYYISVSKLCHECNHWSFAHFIIIVITILRLLNE